MSASGNVGQIKNSFATPGDRSRPRYLLINIDHLHNVPVGYT